MLNIFIFSRNIPPPSGYHMHPRTNTSTQAHTHTRTYKYTHTLIAPKLYT